MTVSLLRIDDRLIHGQVAFGWTSSLGINTILVVNDEAKNDQMKAMALNLAKPSNVNLYIRSIEESGEIIEKFSHSKKSNVLVLVKNTVDARKLIENTGNVIKGINIGGLRYYEGKRKLTDLVAVNEEDVENLKAIHASGVEVEFRMLPRDKRKTLEDFDL
ncbi:PTS sugar transporter subunit IIB [Enterococcus sp. BWT-B8]|uniref:PTS system mannose/fructose/N-acetylgalactosamine-transporter subunit IIB n=1 Tax=unclassified Enterococcus TaxID=2608891 RepID=UPI001E45C165|nr:MULTISPECIES: PTS sugar transporter subunit IIB [unclassified Enterococcus]MCB5951492.1 PTS sugar transporter subunit IIB [Enterococcus sp. BWT-B8]MCB5955051.1 PTS sugar transporter subunit IIB [Enterococcus sp. CWB-B31]